MLKNIADHNPVNEEMIRRESWYDYNFRILALKKRKDALDNPES